MFNVRIPLPFLRLHAIPAATSFRQLNSFTRERGRIHLRFYNSRSILLKPFNSCPPFVYISPSFITRTKKSFTSLAAQTIPDSIDEEKGDQKERYKDHRPKDKKSPINYHVSEGIPLGSIVRVLCTHSEPIEWVPWSAGSDVYDSSSSGLIIPCERKVITNAHCVEHHAQVKLQKHGSTKKYTATVLAVAKECDCALMTVVDEEFWEGVPMVEFSDSLKRSDAVNVVGFPSGRDTTSTTRGVVMFQDTIEYLQSSMILPGFQFGHDEESTKFLEKLKEMLESSDKQPVLLSQIIAADINDGYSEDDFRNTEVVSLNGNPIKNLKSMAEMIDSSKDEFLNFDLKDGKRIVLQTEKAKESTKSILKTYCIHSSMSKDLKPVDHGQEKEL